LTPFLQGPPPALRGVLDVFCAGAAVVSLEIALDKCALIGGVAAASGSLLAADLGVAHSLDGIVAAGTPVGSCAVQEQHAASRADAACKLVDALCALLLPEPSQYLLLRQSLALRSAHLLRTVEWENAAPGMRHLESGVNAAVHSLLHMPPAVDGAFGPGDGAGAAAAAQIALPSRHSGFGLRVVCERETDAARLSAAALSQNAMEGARPAFAHSMGEAQRGVEPAGDFTTPMSSGVVVGNVSIVHPAVPSFTAASATTTGAAARHRDAHKHAHYAP
jgi:hypothetical protein